MNAQSFSWIAVFIDPELVKAKYWVFMLRIHFVLMGGS